MSDILAAERIAHALSGLMLHITENSGFGEQPVVAMLAEALRHVIDTHMQIEVEDCDHEYRAALLDLQHAADKFLESWAG